MRELQPPVVRHNLFLSYLILAKAISGEHGFRSLNVTKA